MEQTFNKLVRDNIPDIIKKNDEVAVTRVLNSEEYRKELYKKLLEETNEVINAKTKNEVLEELADIYEVVRSISELENSDIDSIKNIAEQKKIKRGGFTKRIFLVKTYNK